MNILTIYLLKNTNGGGSVYDSLWSEKSSTKLSFDFVNYSKCNLMRS